MDEHCKLSRRSVLRRVALLAGAVFTAGVAPSKEASGQQKATKEATKYQDKPNGDKQCSNCLQFVPPDGCKVVEGKISPNGYCIVWVKKP